jgi:hypothetical protein
VPSKAGTSPVFIIGLFVGVLALIVVAVAIVIFLGKPAIPEPPCLPSQPCAPQRSLPPIANATQSPAPVITPSTTARPTPAPSATPTTTSVPGTPGPSGRPTSAPATPSPVETPTSNSPPVVLGGSSWRSPTLGYSFEFDASTFELSPDSGDTLAILNLTGADAQVVVEATTADTTPEEMMDREIQIVDTFMIARIPDADDYDAVMGPSIGYESGIARVFSGILLAPDGTPAAPGGVTIMTASDGRITVAVVVVVAQPDALLGRDTLQFGVREAADDIVKSFDWGTAP